MPRGVRTGTVEKKIADINVKIDKKRNEIKELEAKRRELEESNQAVLAAKLVKLAADKGLTIEQLLNAVEK